VTRKFRNGEATVESVQLRELGALHDRRPGRSVCIAWELAPHSAFSVLVVATPHSSSAVAALAVVVDTLRSLGDERVRIFVETEAMARAAITRDSLPVSSACTTAASLPTAGKGQAPTSEPIMVPPVSTLQALPTARASLSSANVNEGVVAWRPQIVTKTPWREDVRIGGIAEDIDLVISLGGDGLILHVVSELFPRAVPPIMPFNMGSMGFLTPFDLKDQKKEIARVMSGENNSVTMRMRLKCVIVPKGATAPSWTSVVADDVSPARSGASSSSTSSWSESDTPRNAANNTAHPTTPANTADSATPALGSEAPGLQSSSDVENMRRVFSDSALVPNKNASSEGRTGSSAACESQSSSLPASRLLRYHVLNEIVIDRGPAPYLSNLEVVADGCPVTRVQADGIIIATPTGSTAYSLSSGGSMVHPSVPAVLFTPICPHSLSFRPVLFPHDVVLQIKVPEDARASDSVVVCASRYPVPTFSCKDPTTDWFASVSGCLRWNERVRQGAIEE
jgi:NAD kinase